MLPMLFYEYSTIFRSNLFNYKSELTCFWTLSIWLIHKAENRILKFRYKAQFYFFVIKLEMKKCKRHNVLTCSRCIHLCTTCPIECYTSQQTSIHSLNHSDAHCSQTVNSPDCDFRIYASMGSSQLIWREEFLVRLLE